MANPNIQLLVGAAKLLKPILGELVFVGGCTTGLLISDKAAADVRPTYDVDAIAEIASYMGYTEFSKRLKALSVRRQRYIDVSNRRCFFDHVLGTCGNSSFRSAD